MVKLYYPFEFNEINLTDTMLKKLGLSEWWGGSGDNNDARLHLNGKSFDIHSTDELDQECGGYAKNDSYVSYHYYNDKYQTMYFLHELYEYIVAGECQEAINDFLERCEKCYLLTYIESYLKFKQSKLNG